VVARQVFPPAFYFCAWAFFFVLLLVFAWFRSLLHFPRTPCCIVFACGFNQSLVPERSFTPLSFFFLVWVFFFKTFHILCCFTIHTVCQLYFLFDSTPFFFLLQYCFSLCFKVLFCSCTLLAQMQRFLFCVLPCFSFLPFVFFSLCLLGSRLLCNLF